jgi:hypothetical protein
MTAAAAEKSCPALPAGFLGHHVSMPKLSHKVFSFNSCRKRSHFIFFPADELMAGINIAFGRNCIIFMSRTASGQPFCNTRSVVERNIEVKEVKGLSVMSSLQVGPRKLLVFFVN